MMQAYDYEAAVRDDVRDWIDLEINLEDWIDRRDELEERLNEDLWVEDSVTGNGSGSYTFNRWEAEENLAHNLDLLADVLADYGDSLDKLAADGAEACDVAIRCHLLAGAVADVLDDLEQAGAFDALDEEVTA